MVNLTFEFASKEEWSGWVFHPEIQKLVEEMTSYTLDLKNELWEPSPMLSQTVYKSGATPGNPVVRYLIRWDLLRETQSEYS